MKSDFNKNNPNRVDYTSLVLAFFIVALMVCFLILINL